jgi:hypothetical protein
LRPVQTRDSVLSYITFFRTYHLYMASSFAECVTCPPPPPAPILPEFDILFIPISPRFSPLILNPLRLLLLLLFFSCPSPRLLLRLDCCPLLLHELLCLFDTCLFFAAVILANLVRNNRDATPCCDSPIRRYPHRLCECVSTLAHLESLERLDREAILPRIAAKLPPANPAASPCS